MLDFRTNIVRNAEQSVEKVYKKSQIYRSVKKSIDLGPTSLQQKIREFFFDDNPMLIREKEINVKPKKVLNRINEIEQLDKIKGQWNYVKSLKKEETSLKSLKEASSTNI